MSKPAIKGRCRYCQQQALSCFGDIYMIADTKSAFRWIHAICLRRRLTWAFEAEGVVVNADRSGPAANFYMFLRSTVPSPITLTFTACSESKRSRRYVRIYAGPWQVGMLAPRSARTSMRTSSFYRANQWARAIGLQHVQAWGRYAQDSETALRREVAAQVAAQLRTEYNVQALAAQTEAERQAAVAATTERRFRGIKLRSKA